MPGAMGTLLAIHKLQETATAFWQEARAECVRPISADSASEASST